ncbi:MAG: transcriptional regulator [Rhizobiales bacterium 32-66-8]|nr:MAG: transcriptional regulator [Rhizobiales bacterium 32-66-8]
MGADLGLAARLAGVDRVLTADIVAAFVANNAISASDLLGLIGRVYAALGELGQPVDVAVTELLPAVPIKKSVTPDFIVCLDDGKKFKSMKRHLGGLGMTPDQYRTKWGLPADYPMVAPNYTATRSALAISNGLGRKAAPVATPPKPKRIAAKAR